MILSARYVRKARKSWDCDWCQRPIVGGHLYLYGMADLGQKPTAMRLHVDCVHGRGEAKVAVALIRAITGEQ